MKPVVKFNKFVRKHTKPVDVATLNEKGLTRLNLITFSKINDLIALAVQRAFQKYERSWDAGEARRLAEEAGAEIRERLALSAGRAAGGGASGGGAMERDAAFLEQRLRTLRDELEQVKDELLKLGGAAQKAPGALPSDGLMLMKQEMLKLIFEENLQLQKAWRS